MNRYNVESTTAVVLANYSAVLFGSLSAFVDQHQGQTQVSPFCAHALSR